LDSDPFDVALTGTADVHFRQHVLSCPLSLHCPSGGGSEYLEDLVAGIDVPRLSDLDITLFHQLILDTPQLSHFICRTPKFEAHDEARVEISDRSVSVALPQTLGGTLELGISCRQSDWQLSSLEQVCSSSFPRAFISAVEHLYIIENRFPRLQWQDDVERSQWLELLHPFTAVKDLYITSEFTPRIAPALQELVRERVTEVLPALQNLFLEEPVPSGPVQEIIGQFVAARRQLAVIPLPSLAGKGGTVIHHLKRPNLIGFRNSHIDY
jgi:hypothetical protein